MSQLSLAGLEAGDTTPRHSLFFALWPDDATRACIDAVATHVEAVQPHGGRRLRPHRYHLTLRWLGDLAAAHERELDAARGAAEAVHRAGVPGFDLALDIAGGFASARVCWLGCRDAPDALQGLRAALDQGLARSGVKFRKAQALVPHVTVARDCRRSWSDTRLESPVTWRIDGLVLIRSDIQRHHAYTVVDRWGLPR